MAASPLLNPYSLAWPHRLRQGLRSSTVSIIRPPNSSVPRETVSAHNLFHVEQNIQSATRSVDNFVENESVQTGADTVCSRALKRHIGLGPGALLEPNPIKIAGAPTKYGYSVVPHLNGRQLPGKALCQEAKLWITGSWSTLRVTGPACWAPTSAAWADQNNTVEKPMPIQGMTYKKQNT